MFEHAPAKINLFLRVVGRRADGYHLLESLAVFAAIADVVAYEGEAPEIALRVEGPFAAGLSGDPGNLVVRAAALAGARGARLRLQKNLPVASGIGGGSADAAAALRLLARAWGVARIDAGAAVRLGADVPVCLDSVPCVMRGIGDALSPAPALPPFGLALVNPGVGVSTAEIFRARRGAFSAPAALPAGWPDAAAMARDLAAWGNDLQAAACALCPPILDVLAALAAAPGCRLAQMSGSGATCFGVFDTPVAAAAAAAGLRRPGWWRWGGGLFGGFAGAGVAGPG